MFREVNSFNIHKLTNGLQVFNITPLNKKKIFNDPVYGFVTFPHEILYDLIDHPYFQRLRRISQQGMSHLVYPGARHTRFHHALGALHLTCKAIEQLRSKGVDITDEEYEATCIAILLHDVGHGPYSHALEHTILPWAHERMSLAIMCQLNAEMNGRLDMAIAVFEGKYTKPFLHQLVSGQLDMDRLDYLTRDSFFTGVAEGKVSYDRIINMLNVRNDQLVVEEKGLFSVEKFLITRRFMYWQVYLHKTGLAAEQMLISFMKRLKDRFSEGEDLDISQNLLDLMNLKLDSHADISGEVIACFCRIDDSDITYSMKRQIGSNDIVSAYLSKALINRKLSKIKLTNEPISKTEYHTELSLVMEQLNCSEKEAEYLVHTGKEVNKIYDNTTEKINILTKDEQILPLDEISEQGISSKSLVKYYICSPKSTIMTC